MRKECATGPELQGLEAVNTVQSEDPRTSTEAPGLEKSDRSDILLRYGFRQSEGSESFLSHICSSFSFL